MGPLLRTPVELVQDSCPGSGPPELAPDPTLLGILAFGWSWSLSFAWAWSLPFAGSGAFALLSQFNVVHPPRNLPHQDICPHR